MMPELFRPIGLTLASVYLILVSLASFCASSHDLRPAPNHAHSENSITHSLLCSWACQVSSKANAANSTHEALLSCLLLFTGVFYGLSVFPTQAVLIPLSARGPPQ
jgi:hypothetical protein